MLTEYLDDLIAKGFIKEAKTDQRKTYSLESKGCEFLAKYRTVLEFFETLGLD